VLGSSRADADWQWFAAKRGGIEADRAGIDLRIDWLAVSVDESAKKSPRSSKFPAGA
jgi:hypothetical protein